MLHIHCVMGSDAVLASVSCSGVKSIAACDLITLTFEHQNRSSLHSTHRCAERSFRLPIITLDQFSNTNKKLQINALPFLFVYQKTSFDGESAKDSSRNTCEI